MTEFTVLTLNTWKCDGHYTQRLATMAQALQVLEPDVILLQEVFASTDGDWDTGVYLEDRLGMYRAFHPARFKSRVVHGEAKDSYSGLAILTKTLIRDHQAVRLPGVEGDTNRWMQTLNIKIAGTAIRIMNTHLTHVCQADDTRLRQTQKILEFAGANAPQNPAILAGDFNAEASDPLMGWLENHNQTPFTRAAMDEPTVHEGARCIDHILVNRGLSVLSVDRVMEKMEGDIHPPSDHYGVMATLALQ